jgi:hypothetical protein
MEQNAQTEKVYEQQNQKKFDDLAGKFHKLQETAIKQDEVIERLESLLLEVTTKAQEGKI